jgi:hypothetical protein
MKKILLLLFCLILSITSFSQSTQSYSLDTLFLKNGIITVGKIEKFTYKLTETFPEDKYIGLFSISTNNSLLIYSNDMIDRISISDSNAVKKSIVNCYNDFLNLNLIIPENKDKPKYIMSNSQMAGSYLKRGASKQTGGIVTTLISGVVGVLYTSLAYLNNSNSSSVYTMSPIPGYVIMGGGTLVGGIMYISGISDYHKAGELLEK